MSDQNDINDGGDDDLFASRTKTLFDESVQGLDAATQSRLTQSRHRALAEIATGTGFGRWNLGQWNLGQRNQWGVPLAGVAAAAVFAVVLWRGDPQVDELVPPTSVADFEILLDQETFEMLQDLEFYSWMDIDDDTGANVG
jgi:hypothetical protein